MLRSAALIALLVAVSASVCTAADPLAGRQAGVADRFARLETLLLRLADVESVENPERASLLQRVVRQAREKFILEQLRTAGDKIESQQFAAAIDGQRSATADLQAMLKLLMSEDRGERIRDEKRRVAELVKQLRLTQREQRSVRARNESGVELEQIAESQESLTEKAKEQLEEITEKRREREPDAEPKDAEPKPADGESSSAPESEQPPPGDTPPGPPPESEPSDPAEAPAPSDSPPPEPSPPNQSPPPSGSPPPEQPPEQPPKPATPEKIAETQLQKAIERMEKAREAVEKEDRQESTEQQLAAETELRDAIDQLEKILRQLREEEVERELAKLDARLRKMLEIENAVIGKTEELARIPIEQRGRSADVRAGQIAVQQQELTAEADRATLLLREEGSSVAFPEVIAAIRRDSVAVTSRLDRTQIDGVTQAMMGDIVEAIGEMLEAVAQAKKDAKDKKEAENRPPGEGQPPGNQDQPLVEAIAELKLLRSMQTRIQRSTDRMAAEVGGPASTHPTSAKSDVTATAETLQYVRDLSDRQSRLYRVTRDLVARQSDEP